MNNRVFWLFCVVVLIAGIVTGYSFSWYNRINVPAFLNIVGLIYDLLGIVVLADALKSIVKWKDVTVRTVAPMHLWFQTVFPLGMLGGSGIAFFEEHAISAGAVATLAGLFLAYSMIPLSILDFAIAFPTVLSKDIEVRWQRFGLFLLLSGVVMQLVAAVLQFNSISGPLAIK